MTTAEALVEIAEAINSFALTFTAFMLVHLFALLGIATAVSEKSGKEKRE